MTDKLYIKTFGCQMNEYDSDRVADLLQESHGMVLTDDPEEANVLLLNTCSIREKAQEKVFSQLGRWQELKRERADLIIGVGGCVASQEGDQILKRAPYVDLVIVCRSYLREHAPRESRRLMSVFLASKSLTTCLSPDLGVHGRLFR